MTIFFWVVIGWRFYIFNIYLTERGMEQMNIIAKLIFLLFVPPKILLNLSIKCVPWSNLMIIQWCDDLIGADKWMVKLIFFPEKSEEEKTRFISISNLNCAECLQSHWLYWPLTGLLDLSPERAGCQNTKLFLVEIKSQKAFVSKLGQIQVLCLCNWWISLERIKYMVIYSLFCQLSGVAGTRF